MTTKTTHTPGPWYVHNLWLGPEGKGPYAYPLGTDPDEAAANARLIAMAPRMVEFIRKLAGHVSEDYADGREARAILRALDTPHAPSPLKAKSRAPCAGQ